MKLERDIRCLEKQQCPSSGQAQEAEIADQLSKLKDLKYVRDWQDAFVLCGIFWKSGSGLKDGEYYGVLFVDEELKDDELVMVPKQDFAQGYPVDDDDDAYLDADELEQILGLDTPDGHHPLPRIPNRLPFGLLFGC